MHVPMKGGSRDGRIFDLPPGAVAIRLKLVIDRLLDASPPMRPDPASERYVLRDSGSGPVLVFEED